VHGNQFVDLDGDGRVDFVVSMNGINGAWQNNGHGWTSRSDWVLPAELANADGTRAGTLLADVDGDGLLDVVNDGSACQLPAGQHLCVWLNRLKTGGGWVRSSAFGTLPSGWSAVNLTTTFTLADMNGDGKADLVYLPGGSSVQVIASTGNGWSPASQSYDTTPLGPIASFHLEDLNRDGLVDLVTTDKTAAHIAGINTGAVTVNGTVWEKATFQADSNVNAPLGARVVGDIDGDGFYDSVSLYGALSGPLTPDLTPHPAGQVQDTITLTGAPSVALATGVGYTANGIDGFVSALSAFGPDPLVPVFPASQLSNALFTLADFNGDGLSDLVLGHPDGGQVLINTGTTWQDVNGFTSRQASAGARGIPVVPTENPMFAGVGATFLDLDGDGLPDLVQAQGNLPGGRVTGAWLNKFRPPVITGFANGLANQTQVSYSVITTADAKASGVYDDSDPLAAGTTYLAIPLRVVASVTRDDGLGLGTTGTTSYQYRSLRGSASGRGPQGFHSVWSEDPTGTTTVTTYAQAYPYTGMPTSVTRFKSQVGGGIPMTSTSTTYCDGVSETGDEPPACTPITGATSAPGTFVFVYPMTVTDTTTLLAGTAAVGNVTTTTELRYDGQGNPTSTTVTTTAPSGESYRKQTLNTFGDPGSAEQTLGKVTRAVVTTQRLDDGSAAITHTTDFQYGEVAFLYPTPGLARTSTLGLQRKRVEPGAGAPAELDTAYAYDRYGNVTITTNCASDFANCAPGATSAGALPFRTSRVSYDPKDFTAPKGAGLIGSLDYSAGRFPVKTTNAAGHVELSAYDGKTGLLLQQTGPNGVSTCRAYDTFGREISEMARCGSATPATTTTARFWSTPTDGQGTKVVTVTRPSTGATTWIYTDSLGRQVHTLARAFAGGFNESFTEYDTLGRLASQSKPRAVGTDALYLTSTSYDALGRVETVTQQLGAIDGSDPTIDSVVTTTYLGAAIQTDRVVGGVDEPRTETKNALGKVASVKDAGGAIISYAYDADGNLTDTTDPAGNVVHLEYDARGRKVLSADPDLGRWSYTYDGFGDLVSQTDPKGQTVAMTYDVLGRMTSKTDPAGTAEWVYDVAPGAGVGKLAAVVSAPDSRLKGNCSIPHITGADGPRTGRAFSYTDGGDIKEEIACVDGETFSTDYEYDALGRQSIVHYPAVNGTEFAVGYHYTSLGFLYYLTDETDHSIYWTATAMNALGQVTDEKTRNGVETVSARDPSTGWLLASSVTANVGGDTLIDGWTYQYDVTGNLSARTRTATAATAGIQEIFGYDALNRLTSSNLAGSTTTESYVYDSLGNLTQKGPITYVYGSGCPAGQRSAGPHAVCTVGGAAPFMYDANGNMVSGNGRTVSYNPGNKPTRIDGGAAGAVDVIYGADGNRVVQDAADPSGGPSGRTLYVGLGATGKSLYERTTRGSSVEHVAFIYAGGAHAGNAFAVRVTTDGSAAATKYNHFDHLGSVVAVTDEGGQAQASTAGAPADAVKPAPNVDLLGYDVWGARRTPDGQTLDPSAAASPAGHREFTSHEAIPGLGLVNMNGRVYDPSLGRFLSPDPNVQFIADLQSYNRYSYVQNNPLRYTDPTGYFINSMFDQMIEEDIAMIGLIACPETGVGCTIAVALAGAAYGTASMVNSGTSWSQAITVNAVGMVAGLAGGGIGDAIGDSIGTAAGQMLGGAIGGAISATVTTAVFGGNLGENILSASAQGAINASFSWAGSQGRGLSQASGSEGAGSGENVAEVRAREQAAGVTADVSCRSKPNFDRALNAVLGDGGYTGRSISFDELLFSADLSDSFRGDPYFGQAGTQVAWTVEIGVSVNLQLGPVNVNLSSGIAFDGSGNVAVCTTVGGGAGVGASASGGLQVQTSNAKTVDDLKGQFYNTSSGAGAGPSASWEVFDGDSKDGLVVGGGFTVGVGVGGGASAGSSLTHVEKVF
jgi:RHS repeat-associated protein